MDPRLQIAHHLQKKRRPRTPQAAKKTYSLQHQLGRTSSAPSPSHNGTIAKTPTQAPAPKINKISPSQAIGYAYEEKAIQYLQNHGLILLAQNLRCPLGELDAVMRDQEQLVFIEIRRRHHQQYGGAIASITPTKRLRLRRAAEFFLPQLSRHFFAQRTPICRFDAIGFEGEDEQLLWLKNLPL